ncbi:MAG: globin [Sulfurovum sp. PC08-66]|nr:MAG: globin [Sulfurovum sp. PC08-66]KIM12563.1 MAG: globin [Sulfuricurvum sp. PC08-66]
MELTISHGTMGVRPPVTKPHPAFFELLGEEKFRALVNAHYEAIRESDIRFLFPIDDEDFEKAKEHAADFMIQITGGPDYFNQHRGAPQMVGRHAPFRITLEARNTWLKLYMPLLQNLTTQSGEPMPEEITRSFWNYLDVFSLWMINTPSH